MQYSDCSNWLHIFCSQRATETLCIIIVLSTPFGSGSYLFLPVGVDVVAATLSFCVVVISASVVRMCVVVCSVEVVVSAPGVDVDVVIGSVDVVVSGSGVDVSVVVSSLDVVVSDAVVDVKVVASSVDVVVLVAEMLSLLEYTVHTC